MASWISLPEWPYQYMRLSWNLLNPLVANSHQQQNTVNGSTLFQQRGTNYSLYLPILPVHWWLQWLISETIRDNWAVRPKQRTLKRWTSLGTRLTPQGPATAYGKSAGPTGVL